MRAGRGVMSHARKYNGNGERMAMRNGEKPTEKGCDER